jgi:xanthine dehydrogenase molybdopterin-binding subunit B
MIFADDDHVWIRPRGGVFTAGPGTCKIPAYNDAPEVFYVTLWENATNPLAVHSSKAAGEPPFFMGKSMMKKSGASYGVYLRASPPTPTACYFSYSS